MRNTDQNYTNVLLEDMNAKLDAIAEGILSLGQRVRRMEPLVGRIPHIESDIQTIKYVMRTTNDDLRAHKHLATHPEHGGTRKYPREQ